MSIPTAIASLIRKRILNGELTSGRRITETRLSKDLKAGQPSVREALFILEREGLVQRIPNVGTFVTELSVESVSGLYQIRRELEGLAAELAARRATEEDIAELRLLIRNMETSAREDGSWGYMQCDLAFHRRLWELSGNKQLSNLLETVVVPLFAFSFMRLKRTPEQLIRFAQLHSVLVDGVASGPTAARRAVQKHMRFFWATIVRALGPI